MLSIYRCVKVGFHETATPKPDGYRVPSFGNGPIAFLWLTYEQDIAQIGQNRPVDFTVI